MGGLTNGIGYIAAAITVGCLLKSTDYISYKIDERCLSRNPNIIQSFTWSDIRGILLKRPSYAAEEVRTERKRSWWPWHSRYCVAATCQPKTHKLL